MTARNLLVVSVVLFAFRAAAGDAGEYMPCKRAADCEDGLGCWRRHCERPSPGTSRGGACSRTYDCSPGLRCHDERRVCVFATTQIGLHGDCVDNDECESRVCSGGRCIGTGLPRAAECLEGRECTAGLTCSGVCMDENGRRPLGDSCLGDRECSTGLRCDDGKCVDASIPRYLPWMPDGTAGPASMRPTLGASFRLGFENCVAERNRTKRGKCYDDLAAEHGFTPPAKTKIRSKWEQAKTASPIDDTETVVLTLESNEAVSEYLRRPSKPKLVLRCLEGETAAYLATETLAHNEPDHLQEAGLTLRFDKDPAVEVYAGESTDGRGFFLPDPESFMRRLTAHKQLVVRYVPFSAPPVVVTFDVGGLDPLLHDIARVCSWRKARRLEEPWNPPANIDTRGIPCTAAGECPGSATCLAGRCTAESGSLEEGEACRADDECEGRLRCDDARHRCRPPNERER